MNRTQRIIKTSIIGIVTNVLLSAFKVFVGTVSHSIAIITDAVNNLSDGLSSLITMIGTRLSDKEPDRKHPFGYGRIEYISTMVIGVIVFYAGIMALRESVRKLITPEPPDYSIPSLIIVSAAIVVKILLGLYTKRTGDKLQSDPLIASGKDALNDAVVSGATLAAAVIYLITGYSIEACVGILIAILILKTGFEILRDTISEILGQRISSELTGSIKKSVSSFPEVEGVYDVTVHNYGKEKLLGSVHIEVPETLTASYLDGLERMIVERVYADTGVILTGISIYSMNLNDKKAVEARELVRGIVAKYPEVLGMHGFYMNSLDNTISFDIVISFDAHDKEKLLGEIKDRIKGVCPGSEVAITVDYDISD